MARNLGASRDIAARVPMIRGAIQDARSTLARTDEPEGTQPTSNIHDCHVHRSKLRNLQCDKSTIPNFQWRRNKCGLRDATTLRWPMHDVYVQCIKLATQGCAKVAFHDFYARDRKLRPLQNAKPTSRNFGARREIATRADTIRDSRPTIVIDNDAAPN